MLKLNPQNKFPYIILLKFSILLTLSKCFQVIKDYQLFMVVGVLLCIDLAIMTTWQISDPFYRATKQMEAYVSQTNEDYVSINMFFSDCC